ncbi:hypothetical protein [uncultured Oscillibacter sp.]|uniref:hypothetical protein n=1 Tax=uncultured Oscillibacter sp. TaxID=876091 RepID=UPI00261722D9|nr:hypothetical protein [uncultured Oscillibacter sp.]
MIHNFPLQIRQTPVLVFKRPIDKVFPPNFLRGGDGAQGLTFAVVTGQSACPVQPFTQFMAFRVEQSPRGFQYRGTHGLVFLRGVLTIVFIRQKRKIYTSFFKLKGAFGPFDHQTAGIRVCKGKQNGF